MLEIILIIYLAKRIGSIAEEKGHKKGIYQFLFVILWIGFEFLGALLAIIQSDGTAAVGRIYFFALLGAGLSCFISFLIVNLLNEKDIDVEDY